MWWPWGLTTSNSYKTCGDPEALLPATVIRHVVTLRPYSQPQLWGIWWSWGLTPNHSYKTCGGPEALLPNRSCKTCGGPEALLPATVIRHVVTLRPYSQPQLWGIWWSWGLTPNHSYKTCGGPEALLPNRSCKTCGGPEALIPTTIIRHVVVLRPYFQPQL